MTTKQEITAEERENIKQFIFDRKQERQRLIDFNDHIKNLKETVGLSEPTFSEIQCKISSRMAFIESSIQDHAKLLTLTP